MSIYLSIYLSVCLSIYLFKQLSNTFTNAYFKYYPSFCILAFVNLCGCLRDFKADFQNRNVSRNKSTNFLPKIKCKSQSKWGHHSITCNKMEIENFSVFTSAPLKVQFTKCCKNQIPLHYLCLLIQYFFFLGQTKQ